ncbi:MAG: radical SAM protein [Bacteroidota bacterium]
MKLKLVSVEAGVSAIGFRRIAASARLIYPETQIYFITPDNLYSFSSHFSPNKKSSINDNDISIIAMELSSANVVAFSSMTASSQYVERISKEIKKINPECFILWGGVHPTLYPEESIRHVDCICIGEGEITISKLVQNLLNNSSLNDLPNTWVNIDLKIKKNILLDLIDSSVLDEMPLPYNGYDCYIYDSSQKKIRLFNKFDYVKFNGLSYRTVWTLGCPFNCSYCANDSFIKLNKGYRKLRYSSVQFIIDEIKNVIEINPFISTIGFFDDNFIALPIEQLKSFVEIYKKEIKIPFVVFGIHPSIINKDKIELLASAGMNRTRMGIQSGSESTLKFFNRHTSINKILDAANILSDIRSKYKMIPPAYDVISDNPFETTGDMKDTLALLYKLPRPYTLNIFSLRVFPKTQLYDYVQENPIHNDFLINTSYLYTKKNMYNVFLFLLATFKPPLFVYKLFLKEITKNGISKEYPVFFGFVKSIYLIKRGFHHIVRFDFSTVVGKSTYYLWAIKSFFFFKRS